MAQNQAMNGKIKQDNYKIFALLSNYLNNAPDFIDEEEVEDIAESGVSKEYAFSVILAAAFGLDVVDNKADRDLFNNYFQQMIHQLDADEYSSNPYYRNINIPTWKTGNSELRYEKYKPYEGFVCDDIIQTKEGRQIPQVGFFDREFSFPAILENGRIWMTITPNEIETMKEPVDQAFGHVLTYGLGLGYYAYMVSEKDKVESVTVVESNQHVIDLFKKHILPQFAYREKVEIIQADAFDYAEKQMAEGSYDFVFTDLWHDVSDGIDMYLRMKEYEKLNPDMAFSYWIEKSILCYL
ncbi:spermine/spermidine synthase domain-containing protein [Virgibacillus sediminis]|uniref:Class I SAM-dependent methyltransferase n=1 Tax=Virgibacillus sediminis TaxID=202260 RepID=A0ABV7A8S0_9BACI